MKSISMKKSRVKKKTRLFPYFHRRLQELDLTYTEAAEILGMKLATFSCKMNGHSPWTEPEMQRCLAEFGQSDEELTALFRRRTL